MTSEEVPNVLELCSIKPFDILIWLGMGVKNKKLGNIQKLPYLFLFLVVLLCVFLVTNSCSFHSFLEKSKIKNTISSALFF